MPLVRISLLQGNTDEYKKKVGDAIHQAMVETMNVPALDRFQLISEHAAAEFIYDAHYLNVARTDDLVIVQITLNAGRSTELKRAFYKRLSELLTQGVKLRPEDLMVSLIEVAKENWSFGNGEAQYAT
jgi:phenylpyruvate tautomerase PptA (4-oxalocrotonate tautomerase family)